MHGSAQFHFVLQPAAGLETRRLDMVNRLILLVPHDGLALLLTLIKRNAIGREYPAELRARQARRIAAGDRNELVFPLNAAAVDEDGRANVVKAIEEFLHWDDQRIAAKTESIEFILFLHIEFFNTPLLICYCSGPRLTF